MQERKSISCFLHAPRPGTEPSTQACALTRDQTSDILLFRKMPRQLSHISHDTTVHFKHSTLKFIQIITPLPPKMTRKVRFVVCSVLLIV